MKNTAQALGIIDAQRGFMPVVEGVRVGLPGFGELPVAEGQDIVTPVNELVHVFAVHKLATFTTQDYHPAETAHFSTKPNFTTTWPVHCVGGTPGAELHPDIDLPRRSRAYTRFIKGFEPLLRGEDDTSYSGYYAVDPVAKRSLPDWIRQRNISKVTLAGLALDYCVGKTALDLRQRMGLEVIVALDASRGIADASNDAMLQAFARHGIQVATNRHIIESL